MAPVQCFSALFERRLSSLLLCFACLFLLAISLDWYLVRKACHDAQVCLWGHNCCFSSARFFMAFAKRVVGHSGWEPESWLCISCEEKVNRLKLWKVPSTWLLVFSSSYKVLEPSIAMGRCDSEVPGGDWERSRSSRSEFLYRKFWFILKGPELWRLVSAFSASFERRLGSLLLCFAYGSSWLRSL